VVAVQVRKLWVWIWLVFDGSMEGSGCVRSLCMCTS
jgi:hypothetical protein